MTFYRVRDAMCERRLPPSVLDKATLQGNEYAWPLTAVEEAITAAAACRLGNLGGQAQFRLPDSVCELYWVSLDPEQRAPGEPWKEYVARSANETRAQFASLRSRTNFVQEGVSSFPILRQLADQGVDLNSYLCFVLYFVEELS